MAIVMLLGNIPFVAWQWCKKLAWEVLINEFSSGRQEESGSKQNFDHRYQGIGILLPGEVTLPDGTPKLLLRKNKAWYCRNHLFLLVDLAGIEPATNGCPGPPNLYFCLSDHSLLNLLSLLYSWTENSQEFVFRHPRCLPNLNRHEFLFLANSAVAIFGTDAMNPYALLKRDRSNHWNAFGLRHF